MSQKAQHGAELMSVFPDESFYSLLNKVQALTRQSFAREMFSKLPQTGIPTGFQLDKRPIIPAKPALKRRAQDAPSDPSKKVTFPDAPTPNPHATAQDIVVSSPYAPSSTNIGNGPLMLSPPGQVELVRVIQEVFTRYSAQHPAE